MPEVASATGMSYGEIQLDGGDGLAGVTVADLAVMTQTLDVGPVDGDLPGLSGAEIAVSTKYAEDHDLAVGDPLTAGSRTASRST